MHFMSIYRFTPEQRDAAVARFKETGGPPPAGVKMLARWHDVGRLTGYTICEADDAVALGIWSHRWVDLMTIETFPVVNDEQMVKVLSA
jgi:Domain of unknown function (DUF3303)